MMMMIKIQRNGEIIEIEAELDDCSFYTILNVCPGKGLKEYDFSLDKGTEIIYGKVITGDMYFNDKLTKRNIIYAENYPENIIGWHQLKDMELLNVNTNNKHVVDVPPVILDKEPRPDCAMEPYLKKYLIGDAKSVIASWVRKGIIERCSSVCSSPVTLTLKTNGKVKIIFDYHELNRNSSKSTGWEENRHEVISSVQLGKFYSVLKLFYGEWQIPLDTHTKYKTTFTFLGQQYVWNRLPGKFCRTPEILSKTLHQILDKLPKNIRKQVVYFRDIMLISAHTKKQCRQLTYLLWDHLEDHGFEMQETDNQICQPQVEYLGRNIRPEGIGLGPNYLEKVQQISSPGSAKELRSILQTLEDARRFTPGFGVFAANLYKIKNNEQDWFWDRMHEKALNDLKRQILKNRLVVPRGSENVFIVEIFVKDDAWMAEVSNSARKPYLSASGTPKPLKTTQKLAVRELKAMKETWGTIEKELKDRTIEWEVECSEVASYQEDRDSVEVNKSLDLSFLFSSKHKIKVVDPSSRKPPIPWPNYM